MRLNAFNQITLSKRTELKPYIARPFKQFELMNDQELLAGVGGTMMVDTENYSNYFLIAFKDLKTQKIVRFEVNAYTGECFNERKLSWIMHSYTTVSFNGIKYDLPLIWLSYASQQLHTLKAASNALINGLYPKQFEAEFCVKIYPTRHIDLIEVCPGFHSLKLYMSRLHSSRIQDVPFNPNSDLTPDEIDIVSDYCISNDLVGTQELYLFNKDRIELRKKLGQEYQTELCSKSDAQMAEAMVAKEIKNKTGKWPKKADLNEERRFYYNRPDYMQFATPQLQKLLNDVLATEFIAEAGLLSKPEIFKNYHFTLGQLKYKFGIGGLHSCEENISYTSNPDFLLLDRDVASYYPAIIINQGLYPSHLGSVFLEVYRKMRDDRIEAKKLKLFAKDKGLKIALNGVSGKFNSEYSIFYDPQCYIQMTLTGQLSILMLAEMFECKGIQVISANTDGIVTYCPQSKYEEMLKWIDYWENSTGFVTEETKYKAYYGHNVNAYFAVKEDGSIKVKGPYSEVGSQTGTKLDNNPITLICSDAVKALLSSRTPIEQTIRECKDITRFLIARNVAGGAHKNGEYLGKVIRWYWAKNVIGTINYIKSGNKVPESDCGQPCMDLPIDFPSDINYKMYIDKTTNILYDVGYLKKIEQVRFF